jgi:transposase
MSTVRTDEFRKDAVRIALTSGLSRQQVADDLGVGKSTLNKWVAAHRDTDVVSPEDRELARENERLRRENRILKEERDILKKATQFFASHVWTPLRSSIFSKSDFRFSALMCPAFCRGGGRWP